MIRWREPHRQILSNATSSRCWESRWWEFPVRRRRCLSTKAFLDIRGWWFHSHKPKQQLLGLEVDKNERRHSTSTTYQQKQNVYLIVINILQCRSVEAFTHLHRSLKALVLYKSYKDSSREKSTASQRQTVHKETSITAHDHIDPSMGRKRAHRLQSRA